MQGSSSVEKKTSRHFRSRLLSAGLLCMGYENNRGFRPKRVDIFNRFSERKEIIAQLRPSVCLSVTRVSHAERIFSRMCLRHLVDHAAGSRVKKDREHNLNSYFISLR